MSIHKKRYKRQQAAISRNIKLKSRSHGITNLMVAFMRLELAYSDRLPRGVRDYT